MKRIYVIDDEPDNRDLLSYVLTGMNYDVQTFVDGESGLKAIITDPPDLIILDRRMPGMDGIEVTMRIRAVGINVPIMMFTASGFDSERDSGYLAGVNHYVVKPFNLNALAAYVKEIVGGD